MNLSEIIVEDLQQARAYAIDMISHVDDSLWFRQPAEGVNHVAWQVGHMAVAQYGLCLKRVRGVVEEDRQLIPAEFSQLFGKGSTPTSDATDYPAPETLLEVFHAVHAAALELAGALDEATLAEKTEPPHPMFTTKGGGLRFSAKHEMLHVGQIGLLRRFFGSAALR